MSGTGPAAIRSISTLLTTQPLPEHIIMFGQRGNPTWQQFARDVSEFATGIREFGGDRWLIASDDTYDVAVGLFATFHAGATAMFPANLQSGHLNRVTAKATGILGRKPVAGCDLPFLAFGKPIDTSGQRQLVPIESDQACIHLHTSGSTGEPVTISKPLRCLEAEVATLDALFPFEPRSCVIGTVPPYHIYGLLFRVLWPLMALRRTARDLIHFPGELDQALKQVRKALLISSPAFLKRTLPVLDLDRLDGQLCGLFSSGGPLPPEVAAAYNQSLSSPLVEIYGSTETGGIASRIVSDALAPPAWTPLPRVRASLDDSTRALKVASPFLPDENWYLTGDHATLRPDGRFELHGRLDRIVKIEEQRVSLAEMERNLKACSTVTDARIVKLDSSGGQRTVLGAMVVPSETGWQSLRNNGKLPFRTSLLAALRTHHDGTTLPRRWRFVRQIPETMHGKVKSSELKALFNTESDDLRPLLRKKEQHASGVRLTLQLQPELRCFDGHFEGMPILAGVAQINWALRLAGREFLVPHELNAIEALKFFRVITPDSIVELELAYDAGNRTLDFRYLKNDQVCSTGRARFHVPT